MSTQPIQSELLVELLRQARDELRPGAANSASPLEIPTEAAAQFEMFLDNNELELAWDALAAIADATAAPKEAWQKLLLAAGLMSLGEQAHLAAVRLCSSNRPTQRAS